MLDRTLAPNFTIPRKLDLLKPLEITLGTGVPVFIFNGGNQPVIRIELVYKSGRWYETLPGRAYFSAKMLSEGSQNFTSAQIASIFESHGAHFEVQPGFDYTTLTLHTLTSKLTDVLPVLLDLVINPVYSPSELEKLKDIYVQNLEINLEKNSYFSTKLMREALYGLGHPYGRDIEIDEVLTVTSDELREFHFENYTDPKVFISGAFSQNQLEFLLNKLKILPFKQKKNDRQFHTNKSKQKLTLDKPESTQSSLKLATLCVNRNDPDYFNLLLFNHVLGGYFGSRLMKNIREEKGLTYGIHSSVNAFKNGSHFAIGAEVNKENNRIVIEEIHKELSTLTVKTIPKEEYGAAVNNFIGSIQSDLSTIFAHADKSKNIKLFNLSEDYYDEMIAFFSRSSPDTIKSFAKRFIKDVQFNEIIVG